MGVANRLRAEFRDLTEHAWESGMIWGDLRTWAGPQVTANTALTSIAVLACVKLLADTIAGVPLLTYEHMKPRGKQAATDHWLYDTLAIRPNPEMTSMEWRECTVGHLALRGNAYCNLVPTKRGGYEIWPLRPDRMVVRRVPANEATNREPVDSLQYLYTLPSGEQRRLYAGRDLIHFRGLSSDGILGYSPIQLARQGIGLDLGLEEYGARFFSNGARPSGFLKSDKRLSKEASGRLKENWNDFHQGLENSHRIAILEEGISYQQVGVSPDDAAWLQSREFSLHQIARLFRVPPHMLGETMRLPGNAIQQISGEWVKFSIAPWCERIEQRLYVDLLWPDRKHFVRHYLDGLLRGSLMERYESYAIARQWGWLSSNDIRDAEGMNQIPGGETYWQPVNMEPLGTVQPKGPQVAHRPGGQPDEPIDEGGADDDAPGEGA